MVEEFFTTDDLVEYMTLLLKVSLARPEICKDYKNSSLSESCFATLNLLDLHHSDKFYNYIGKLKENVELCAECKLEYYYLHMVDYSNGGVMTPHKHDHNEDFSFILYLNDCNDGHTILKLSEPCRVKPDKGKVLLFSSDIIHQSEYSRSKRVLVGGLKRMQEQHGH